ncbi:MAG: M20/M25/M40 family metallo-hydrolase [Planctomycetota bacterium]
MKKVARLLFVFAAGCALAGGNGGSNGGSNGGGAGAAAATPLAARCQALFTRALDDNEAMATLRRLVAVAPKRLSGSAGFARAVDWGQATMRDIGLENIRLEPCMVPCWVRGEERAEVTSGGAPLPLRVTALGGSVGTGEGGVEAEVVEVRTFEQLQAMGGAAKGKIVFFNRPMPRALKRTGQAYGEAVPQRSDGAVQAAKVGGVAALVRSMTTAIDGYPHTGAMHYADGVPQVPAAAIATADAEELSKRLQAGPVRVRLVLGCETRPDVPGANVVGDLRGGEHPEEIVLIGGHLDAWDLGTGAHDDGAGCAHVLEAARLLVACGVRPRRTIRVVLFANEENGLRGAKAYAEAHAGEIDKHKAAIETDGGGFTPMGFASSLDGAEAKAVEALFAPLRDWNAGLFLPAAGGCGADIGVLYERGVPCFGLWVDGARYFDYHHTAVDDLPAVNERELALGAAAVAFAASTIADR